MSVRNRTVWVTGSSRGIGLGIARRFARAGHRVVLHCVSRESLLKEEAAKLEGEGCTVMCVSGDITDESAVERMLREIKARFGPVEILVNNAGIALPEMLFTDCTPDQLRRVTDTDLIGTMLVTRAVIPDMVTKKAGSIVNIASYLGLTGCSCEAPYAAAKAGIIGLTKSLAMELSLSGIRVNAVAPGYVPTEMNGEFAPDTVEEYRAGVPLQRLGTPEDIAEAVYFLALDETAGFITGQTLAVDGGSSLGAM